MKKIVFITSLVLFSSFCFGVAAKNIGENLNFNIDPDYDISARQTVAAILVKTSPKLYFYIEKNWWDSQNFAKQNEILAGLDPLAQEFENRTYPILTSVFGSEWKPGVDGDDRITLLFHLMKNDIGGYFRSADEYLKIQVPDSNEKEMLFLPIAQLGDPQLKTFLAHELIHLITFNQKDKNFGVSEETWLNEARAEYAITFLGYDSSYEGSNLQRRVQAFLEDPTDSVTEWQGKKSDYGSLNIFIQYLVDHYSVGILTDSLKSKSIGIASLNEALKKDGFLEDFSQIFTDWTIAVFVNDCSLGKKYCYLNKNLTNLRVTPALNFLPLAGKSSLSVTNVTKSWTGEWQRFIGGNSTLKLEFQGLAGLNFKVPCLIQDQSNKFQISFLTLDKNQTGDITVPDFGLKNKALVIIPSLQTKTTGFDGAEPTYPFTFIVSIINGSSDEEAINQLLLQIDFLKKEIAKVQAQINTILASRAVSCRMLSNNLYFGLKVNSEVRCLQEFLKWQGSQIYPEGLVTGNFGSLTRAAVIRFQNKYPADILAPLGLSAGNGIVGLETRAKINQLLGGY